MGCWPPWTWAPEGHGDTGHHVTVDVGMSAAVSPRPLLVSPHCPQHLTSLLSPSQCPHPPNVVPSITISPMPPLPQCHLATSWCHHLPDVPKATVNPMSPLAPTSPCHLLVTSTQWPQDHHQPHAALSPPGATAPPPTSSPVPALVPLSPPCPPDATTGDTPLAYK